MEAALVSVSTGVMSSLLGKLANLLGGEYKLLTRVRGEIKFLEGELRSMNAVLQRLEGMQKLDSQMKEWRDRVRELAYDIEDCIDLFMHQLGSSDVKVGFGQKIASQLQKVRASHKIGYQIQQLKARVVEESERQKRYQLGGFTSASSVPVKVDPRLAALYVDEERLVGIDVPRDEIIERLLDRRSASAQQIMTISIVGCGGLGKTTLANQIYCKIKGKFQCAAFVSVFQNPNIKNVLMNILSQVATTAGVPDDEQHIINKLREYLSDKRYFVVIDDVWDMQIWRFIECALVKNCHRSRIITTTRIYDIAKLCCSSHSGHIYEMKPLSIVDSKRMFFKRIFDLEERCPPELKEAADEILKKCGGLPLAIISISSLLASKPKSRDQWNKVKVSLSCTLERTPDIETMRWVLSLSYSDLPNHLKTCLLYLSIFPESYEINRERLVSRWIAEGFVHQKHGQNAYEVGDSYFNELVNRSLIQPANIRRDGQMSACRVDDTIHDFIVSVSIEENFVTLFGGSKLVPMPHSKVRRLSLQNGIQENIIASKPLLMSRSHIRSLTIFVNSEIIPSLLGFNMLRVLDLEDCYALENRHLANMERLVQLRYLNIRGSRVSELPKQIGELQYLETLDIRATDVEELPSAIARLRSLVRLFVDYHVKLPQEISSMQALEELTSFSALLYPPSFLKELGQLTNLRVLRVIFNRDGFEGDAESYMENLATSLCKLGTCNLHSLFIDINGYSEDSFSLDMWHPVPCRLRRFSIDRWCPIYKVPDWMGSLINLEELVLYVNKIWQEDLQLLGHLPALQSLTIYSNTALPERTVISGFQSSKFFKLYCNSVGLTFEAGSMLKLECLDVIINASRSKTANGRFDFGMRHLINLRNVYIQLDRNGSTRGELEAAEAAIKSTINSLPGHPKLNLRIF